jgi:hypothetical protein
VPRTRDYDFWSDYRRLIAAETDTEALLLRLSEAEPPARAITHFALLTLRGDDLFDRVQSRSMAFASRSVLAQSIDRLVVELSFRHKDLDDDDRTVIARLSIVPNTSFVLLVTIASAKQWRLGVNRFIDWLYPTAYRTFLRQSDLHEIFVRLEESLRENFYIRFTKVSSARRLLTSATARRTYQSEVLWTDLDPTQAFADADAGLQYFRSISFDVSCRNPETRAPSETGIVGTVTRDMHFSSNSDAHWMYQAGVGTALDRAAHDKELNSNRALETPSASPSALTAQFNTGIALERSDLPRIAGALKKMPRAAVSILHGNPYLHASVVDMQDGSGFNVMVLSERSMLIVPQLRATENAVSRLCQYIYEQIGECEFYDAKNSPETAVDDA